MAIVTAAQWGARVGRLPSRKMILPATQLILHHSVTTTTALPVSDMKIIERVGLERFGQISYSFAVHQDGTVLEGCGLRVGAHTAGQNSYTFGVVWIGNYDVLTPTPEQIRATRWLIWYLQGQGHLKLGTFPTGGHKDVKGAATACPGVKAYRVLDELRQPWVEPQIVPPVKMEVPPMFNPPHEVGRVVAALGAPDEGVWLLNEDGMVFAYGGAPYKGGPYGHEYWGDRKAATLIAMQGGYIVVASSGEQYHYV